MGQEVTHGVTRDKLLQMGYAPTSATAPGAFGYQHADDAGAVLCLPSYDYPVKLTGYESRNVVGLLVTVKDKVLRTAINALFDKHVGKCPTRLGSDGSELRVARWDDQPAYTRESSMVPGEYDPAVVLLSMTQRAAYESPTSAAIRLDGAWKHGDLLSTRRDKLPALDADRASALFADVERAMAGPVTSAGPQVELKRFTPWIAPDGSYQLRPEAGYDNAAPAPGDMSGTVATGQHPMARAFARGRQV